MFSQHSLFRLRADKLQRRVSLSQDTIISKNLAAFMHRINRNTVWTQQVTGIQECQVWGVHIFMQSSVGPSGSPFFQSAYILLYLHPTYSGLEERDSIPLQNRFPTLRLHSVTT
jgi:hypothetical protein